MHSLTFKTNIQGAASKKWKMGKMEKLKTVKTLKKSDRENDDWMVKCSESGEAIQRSKLPCWGEWGIQEVLQIGVRVSVCLYYNFGNHEESDVKAFEEELWEKWQSGYNLIDEVVLRRSRMGWVSFLFGRHDHIRSELTGQWVYLCIHVVLYLRCSGLESGTLQFKAHFIIVTLDWL